MTEKKQFDRQFAKRSDEHKLEFMSPAEAQANKAVIEISVKCLKINKALERQGAKIKHFENGRPIESAYMPRNYKEP